MFPRAFLRKLPAAAEIQLSDRLVNWFSIRAGDTNGIPISIRVLDDNGDKVEWTTISAGDPPINFPKSEEKYDLSKIFVWAEEDLQSLKVLYA